MRATGPVATFARRLSLTALAAMFGTLGVVQVLSLIGAVTSLTIKADKTGRLASVLQESTLPDKQAGFERAAFASTTRESDQPARSHSAVWTYRRPGLEALVACDFPFVGWNSLGQTYVSQGWEIVDYGIVSLPVQQDRLQSPFVAITLRGADGRTGVLVYSLFDSSARPLLPPGTAGLIRFVLVSSHQRSHPAASDRLRFGAGRVSGASSPRRPGTSHA